MLPGLLPCRLPILRSLDRLARSGQCRPPDQEDLLRNRPAWTIDQCNTLSTSSCQVPLCPAVEGNGTSPRSDQDSLGNLDWQYCRLWSVCIRHLRSGSILWQSYRFDRCHRLRSHGCESSRDSRDTDTDIRSSSRCISGYTTSVIAVKNHLLGKRSGCFTPQCWLLDCS